MSLNFIILKTITIIHILYILFVVLTPFLNMNYFLVLHSFMIPFMLVHWVTNDNTCFLTLVERGYQQKVYNKVDDRACFTCNLIEPVYDFKNNYESVSDIIYMITFSLWFYTIYQLYTKYKNNEIKNYKDLITF